jgi:SpoVT / AbrB like domain.
METIRGVRLLRTRHTDSRQFTIPKEVREKYGIKPGDYIEILSITPLS